VYICWVANLALFVLSPTGAADSTAALGVRPSKPGVFVYGVRWRGPTVLLIKYILYNVL
jgi:hypothetical protein